MKATYDKSPAKRTLKDRIKSLVEKFKKEELLTKLEISCIFIMLINFMYV
jgi:hypothetical protein